jgi:hypothetical protein
MQKFSKLKFSGKFQLIYFVKIINKNLENLKRKNMQNIQIQIIAITYKGIPEETIIKHESPKNNVICRT